MLWTLKYVQLCLNVLQYSYLQKVKDSWRVVNPRDIIPTVPRLMGYCHVAQPVYLAGGELKDALVGHLFSSVFFLNLKLYGAFSKLHEFFLR